MIKKVLNDFKNTTNLKEYVLPCNLCSQKGKIFRFYLEKHSKYKTIDKNVKTCSPQFKKECSGRNAHADIIINNSLCTCGTYKL